MKEEAKDKFLFFLMGFIIGIGVTVFGGLYLYKTVKGLRHTQKYETVGTKQAGGKKTAQARPRKDFNLSFENKEDAGFFKPAGGTEVEVSDLNATDGKKSLMVKMKPEAQYPGLEWEVYGRHVQNWKGAGDFHFDVFNNNEDYVSLQVKFKSGKKYPKKKYTRTVQLEPMAMNHIKIPMDKIADKCDIAQISYVKIFASKPSVNIVLFFDNIGTK